MENSMFDKNFWKCFPGLVVHLVTALSQQVKVSRAPPPPRPPIRAHTRIKE